MTYVIEVSTYWTQKVYFGVSLDPEGRQDGCQCYLATAEPRLRAGYTEAQLKSLPKVVEETTSGGKLEPLAQG